MYLSRLTLNPRNRRVRRDLSDCGEMHRTVMSAFPAIGQSARSRFGVLYRVDGSTNGQVLLCVQSKERPDWSHLEPDCLLEEPAVKPVDHVYAALRAPMVARFRLRANPTRKIDTKTGADGQRRHGRRVELRTEAECLAWLHRKASSGGFAILSVEVNPQVLDVTSRSEHKTIAGKRHSRAPAPQPLTFASVLFEGHLRITDAEQFRVTLEKGIGPGKAYGFGLLSLAPPSS